MSSQHHVLIRRKTKRRDKSEKSAIYRETTKGVVDDQNASSSERASIGKRNGPTMRRSQRRVLFCALAKGASVFKRFFLSSFPFVLFLGFQRKEKKEEGKKEGDFGIISLQFLLIREVRARSPLPLPSSPRRKLAVVRG